MANPNNIAMVEGNLVDDVRIFTNEDNSRTILGTVMVNDNFRSRDGNIKSRPVGFRHRVNESLGGWAYTGKGDRLKLFGRLDTPSWIDKNTGERVYGNLTFDLTEYPVLKDSREVTEARRQKHAQEQGQNQQNNAAPVAQQPAAGQAPAYGQNPVQQNQNPAQYNAPVAPVAPQMPQQNAPMYGGQPVQNNQPQAPQGQMQQPQQNAPIGSNVAPVAPGQYNTGPSAF